MIVPRSLSASHDFVASNNREEFQFEWSHSSRFQVGCEAERLHCEAVAITSTFCLAAWPDSFVQINLSDLWYHNLPKLINFLQMLGNLSSHKNAARLQCKANGNACFAFNLLISLSCKAERLHCEVQSLTGNRP